MQVLGRSVGKRIDARMLVYPNTHERHTCACVGVKACTNMHTYTHKHTQNTHTAGAADSG